VIVVDTNVIAYLFVHGDRSKEAREVFTMDPEWTAPLLWRSEFRSVLLHYMRLGDLVLEDAVDIFNLSQELMHQREYEVESRSVLALARDTNCSAYDCEFVTLAISFSVPLVTADRQILKDFPDVAVPMADFSR